MALITCADPARALQVLDARDGVAIEAVMSIREATRIRIDGAPITDVFGNVYSSSCGPTPTSSGVDAGTTPMPAAPEFNPSGEVVIECDRDKGEIYIRPVGDAPKPVNLFVSSAQATYTLVLRKADTPADTIVIRDRSLRAVSPSSGADTHRLRGAAPDHIRALKAMLVAMAADRLPTDIRVEDISRQVQLWEGVTFAQIGRYDGRGLVGERYLLQNVGQDTLVLAEQEFDRVDGALEGQVLAVAVEHHNLRPGDMTNVFVIRRAGPR
ncbi:type-F conjugative transfer system secretin TraK [Rubrivivax albus]|uniref:type-F conjugative transfer system secretin TraK n=1 Tax=Rubrivivax albus TaxID=2499835 RepID=UPI0018EE83AC|nr:type-F conjugative transfer system secretin TraK [Rubrivivax albus]